MATTNPSKFTRKKEYRIGSRMKASIASTLDTVEHSLGIIGDTMDVVRENLREVQLEQRIETARIIAEGVKALVTLGYTEDEAIEYLSR